MPNGNLEGPPKRINDRLYYFYHLNIAFKKK